MNKSFQVKIELENKILLVRNILLESDLHFPIFNNLTLQNIKERVKNFANVELRIDFNIIKIETYSEGYNILIENLNPGLEFTEQQNNFNSEMQYLWIKK
jgi:hypothetical protein